MRDGLRARIAAKLTHWFPMRRPFRLLLTHYHREPTYSLALASLSAYAKVRVPGIQVRLVDALRGDDPATYARDIGQWKPDLIAVSSTHPNWLPFQPYLDQIGAQLSNTPVLIGGYQAIFNPEETLGHPAVDYVCVGDGEKPLVDLIRRLRGSGDLPTPVRGLWEKGGGGEILKSDAVLTEDLSEMPFPDYGVFERDGSVSWIRPNAIESKKLTSLPVMTGRGCPYRCTYCSNVAMLDLYRGNGKYLRRYDPHAFTEELLRLRNRYQVDFFQFVDETFLWDKEYAVEFLSVYRERVGLPFSMFSRVEQMTDEYCALVAKAGCHSIWYGVESGSEEYRRRYLGRRMSNRHLIEAADTAHRHGIKIMTFAMVGLPFETRRDVVDTLALIDSIKPELAIFSQFVPLPGTPLHKLAEEAGLLPEESDDSQMWRLGHLNLKERPGSLTAEELSSAVEEIMAYVETHNAYDE